MEEEVGIWEKRQWEVWVFLVREDPQIDFATCMGNIFLMFGEWTFHTKWSLQF